MRIKIFGDWAPCLRAIEPISLGPISIVNIEGPILRSESGHEMNRKAGPHLFHASLPVCNKGVFVASLANNHLMDFGTSGLRETFIALESRGGVPVGAGFNLNEAEKPLILNCDGVRIGVLSRCEVQFGGASHRRAGVAAFDSRVYQVIRVLKRECDFVIVSVHSAAEMCPWPSPRRQDTWRALVEAGADLIHGHHAHVPQGWETYKQGLIFYGLGNFCVDPAKWQQYPHALWSLAPELTWTCGHRSMHPATAVIEDLGDTVRVRDVSTNEAEWHQRYLADCNKPLGDRRLLEGLWQEASIRMYRHHYGGWLGFEQSVAPGLRLCAREVLHRVGRLMGLKSNLPAPRQVAEGQYILWYHLFACDSHNDAIATALGVLGGTLEDLRSAETARMVDEMMPSM